MKTNRSAQIRVLHSRYPELGPSALAKRVGVAPSTAHGVLKRFLTDSTEAELRDFQANRADVIDAVAHRFIGSITDAKLKKASATSLATGFGILHDKSQVLRGLPSSVDVHVLLDLAAIVRGDKG